MPKGYKIKREKSNNLLLQKGRRTYLLFYNHHEAYDSEGVYDTAIEQTEYDVNDDFRDDKSFGFLLMKANDDQTNELIVGIGGVKLTAQSKTKNMVEDTRVMMEIAKSVKIK
ncbi:hypothetical protein [Cytobacillus purgationiresistens]|uniref:Uncharacterized protein n=1 Tax=Cytobacillus purgationiresistens TaxID=863449 RepID=A0ABU0ALR9_9BACI|nr:hypothetical protein [Cytobacillus purgationiresistens]MDQ0272216.1 hypothetical protein [Cytobacillus purgationiresistens]